VTRLNAEALRRPRGDNAYADNPQSSSVLLKRNTSKVDTGKSHTSDSSTAEFTNLSRMVDTQNLYDCEGGSNGVLKKAVGSVSLPSLGGKRRVHNDGILMLDNHFVMKDVET